MGFSLWMLLAYFAIGLVVFAGLAFVCQIFLVKFLGRFLSKYVSGGSVTAYLPKDRKIEKTK